MLFHDRAEAGRALGHEEFAMGAIATGGVRVMSDDVVRELRLPPEAIDAVAAAEERELHRIVVAVPVAARSTCEDLRRVADDVVCALTPEPFLAVGQWYQDFSQTTDDEVRELLRLAQRPAAAAAAGQGRAVTD